MTSGFLFPSTNSVRDKNAHCFFKENKVALGGQHMQRELVKWLRRADLYEPNISLHDQRGRAAIALVLERKGLQGSMELGYWKSKVVTLRYHT